MNRIEIMGCRVSLEQCGSPHCFWPQAMMHFAFSRNIYPVGDRDDSPYERKFGEKFPGIRAPFMARIRFQQVQPLQDSTETPRVGPTRIWGVFLGWDLKPGGYWTGRYQCAALTEFIGMDLRVGGHIRVQHIAEVEFDSSNVFFPQNRLYI